MPRPAPRPVIAVVGGASLVGREIRDLLAVSGLPASVKPIGAEEEEIGTLTEQAGEAVIMTALDEDTLAGSRLVFLAGPAEASRKALAIMDRIRAEATLIDLTSFHEDSPRGRLRAPMVEAVEPATAPDAVHVIAHPAAIVLTLFLSRLRKAGTVRRSVAHIFEPASQRGQRGIDELKDQTVNLLTFKALPKDIFDEQAGFNLLSRYGSQAPEPLEGFELRVERHLATLLSAQPDAPPMPSLRLVQAPVFHGYSVSIWAELEENPGAAELERALATSQIDVRGVEHEAPTNVGIAGQSGIAVGDIRVDRNNPRAAWFWIAADNLRIAAENAVGVARSLLASGG